MRGVLLAGLLALAAAPGAAQEFAAPAPACARSVSALLERGLPASAGGASLEALVVRWHGLPELTTRSVAAGIAWRSARVAAGISQTGGEEIGWSALVLAAGVAHPGAGAALRVGGRMPQAARSPALAPGRGGLEAGAGAWMVASQRLMLWASAPQLWTLGEPPPLERWLELGGVLTVSDARLWLARSGVPGPARGLRGEHLAGLAVAWGPATLWVEARDHPPRGTLGVEAAARLLRVAATLENHPVLGETARLAVALSTGTPDPLAARDRGRRASPGDDSAADAPGRERQP